MDWMEDLLSSLWGEMTGWDFNPEDYSVDAEVNIYPNQEGEMAMQEEGEMPKYTVEDLKIDIEPMLYDMSIEDISMLVGRMFKAWNDMHNGGWESMPMPVDMGMPEDMGMPMNINWYAYGEEMPM